MSASVGMLGGARAQYHLRQIFVFLNVYPVNGPEVILPFAQDKFDATSVPTYTKVSVYTSGISFSKIFIIWHAAYRY